MNIGQAKRTIALLGYHLTIFQDNLLFYGGKIIGRFVFPFVIILNYKQYINQDSYYPECELKSPLRILWEQFLYIFQKGEINKNYFIFGFDRKSKNDFKEYVPWLTFTHARNKNNQLPKEPVYDFNNDVCLVRDKFVFEACCRSIGINTPLNIGLINKGKFYSISEKSYKPLESLTELNISAFCKKNVSYGGGIGRNIFKLIIKDGVIYINNELSNLKSLIEIFGNDHWIIQHSIKNQAEAYSRFHPHSINTTRIVTVQHNGDIEVLCAFFRMGVNGRHADNWSSGGIIVGIDIDKGIFEKWGFFKPGNGTKSSYHPNSKLEFEGYELPDWKEMVQYVKKAHSLFYGIHPIGWDVVVTDDGITLIEGNDNWETLFTQFYKGARSEFEKYFGK